LSLLAAARNCPEFATPRRNGFFVIFQDTLPTKMPIIAALFSLQSSNHPMENMIQHNRMSFRLLKDHAIFVFANLSDVFPFRETSPSRALRISLCQPWPPHGCTAEPKFDPNFLPGAETGPGNREVLSLVFGKTPLVFFQMQR